jgi:pimeloyl-ACP methyl ester carboxylesterase
VAGRDTGHTLPGPPPARGSGVEPVDLLGMPEAPVRWVLLPGLGLDERSSARLRRQLPADVVLLPGMGLADRVPTLGDLAGRLLDRAGEGPVVLVGHSQSCQ